MPSRSEIDPRKPGYAPTCLDRGEQIKKLESDVRDLKDYKEAEIKEFQNISSKFDEVRTEIGHMPDVTAPDDERSGSGIKGALYRILERFDDVNRNINELKKDVTDLSKRVDDKRKNPPSGPAANASAAVWGKRLGWIFLILALGYREARNTYYEISGAHAAPTPRTSQIGR